MKGIFREEFKNIRNFVDFDYELYRVQWEGFENWGGVGK